MGYLAIPTHQRRDRIDCKLWFCFSACLGRWSLCDSLGHCCGSYVFVRRDCLFLEGHIRLWEFFLMTFSGDLYYFHILD